MKSLPEIIHDNDAVVEARHFHELQAYAESLKRKNDALLSAAKAVDSLIDGNWQLAHGLSNRDWVLAMQKLRRAVAAAESPVEVAK
jgi:hypothetical protein